MNVFDEEIGPLESQAVAQRIAALAGAGMTLAEFRAYIAALHGVN